MVSWQLLVALLLGLPCRQGSVPAAAGDAGYPSLRAAAGDAQESSWLQAPLLRSGARGFLLSSGSL